MITPTSSQTANPRPPKRRPVMVTGFSPGASGALGLGRAPALLNGELARLNPSPQLGAKISVLYAAYTLVGFNRVHHLFTSPAEVFQPARRTQTASGHYCRK